MEGLQIKAKKKKILGNNHTHEERLDNRPTNVPIDHFVALIIGNSNKLR